MMISILPKSETRHIQLLIERRNSLEELILILTHPTECELHDRAKADLMEIEHRITIWWDRTLRKYNLEIGNKKQYRINFFTCELTATIDNKSKE